MATITAIEMIWDRTTEPMRPIRFRLQGGQVRTLRFFPAHIIPDASHPVGQRGLLLASCWETLGRGKADGMLCKDGDVAIDPVMMGAMFDAIESDPERVWTAPVRIWPVATGRGDWTWGHWTDQAGQKLEQYPNWFSFSFTYLPAALLEYAIKDGLVRKVYPGVDAFMSATAQKKGVKAEMVADCWPVHNHW